MGIIQVYRQRDPAARNWLEILLLYPGLHAVFDYRVASFFHRIKLRFLARAVSQWSRFWTGIEIHPGAKIGKGLFIDHGSGVVVGETAEIGDYCMLFQGVTLGGTGKDVGKRHPTLGNDVMVGAGAKILGPVSIGSHAKIAAGAVVLCDVPRYATAAGVPAKVVRIADRKPPADEEPRTDLDWINIPDPVAQELARMSALIEGLERRLADMESGSGSSGRSRRRDAGNPPSGDTPR
jgi:serine O-acetyltransferase